MFILFFLFQKKKKNIAECGREQCLYVREECKVSKALKDTIYSMWELSFNGEHPYDWIYEIVDDRGKRLKVKHTDVVRADVKHGTIAKYMKKNKADKWGYSYYLQAVALEQPQIVLDGSELLPANRVFLDEIIPDKNEPCNKHQSEDAETSDASMDMNDGLRPDTHANRSHSPKYTFLYNYKESAKKNNELLKLFYPVSKKQSITNSEKPNVGLIVVMYHFEVTDTNGTIMDYCDICCTGTGTIIDKHGKVVATAAHVVSPFFNEVTYDLHAYVFFFNCN